jgi:hypothetical protein
VAGGLPWGPSAPCPALPGRANVSDFFGINATTRNATNMTCSVGAPDYQCWRAKISEKFPPTSPGWWYSTLDSGCGRPFLRSALAMTCSHNVMDGIRCKSAVCSYCPFHPGSLTNCTWDVTQVVKVVDKKCHDKAIWSAVRFKPIRCCTPAQGVRCPILRQPKRRLGSDGEGWGTVCSDWEPRALEGVLPPVDGATPWEICHHSPRVRV